MRLTVLTLGSRGDVEPCLALAVGLRRAGHEVTFATGADFEPFVAARGVRFAPLRVDVQHILRSDKGKKLLAGRGIRAFLRPIPADAWALRQRLMEDAWVAARGADAVVYHPRVPGAYDAAEKLRVPAILADYLPQLTPTREFPFPLFPCRTLGGFVNRLSFRAFGIVDLPFAALRNRWRARALGLPPRPWHASDLKRNGRPLPVLYHFSKHLVPPPADWRGPIAVTGPWFLDPPPGWRPPADLSAFLDAGPPPVFVGFGSMVSQDPGRMTAVVVEALRLSGQRGILMTGWGGLARAALPETIFTLDEIPHGWLFPHVAAVVHHGGAGTTAAGLRAGKPTVVCPYFHDQPFWGRRVHDLGVGPRPVPQRHLTADRLAEAIRVAVGKGMRQRAEALGEKVRAEDGVARAVEVIAAWCDRKDTS
jgi:sterol 3beta-glucosyltransferase